MQGTSNTKRLYRVLSPEDREEIMIGKRQGESIRSIAKRLGRNPSVISREIQYNSTEDNRYQAGSQPITDPKTGEPTQRENQRCGYSALCPRETKTRMDSGADCGKN